MLDCFESVADEMSIFDPELRLIFISELKERLCHSIHIEFMSMENSCKESPANHPAGLINSKYQAPSQC